METLNEKIAKWLGWRDIQLHPHSGLWGRPRDSGDAEPVPDYEHDLQLAVEAWDEIVKRTFAVSGPFKTDGVGPWYQAATIDGDEIVSHGPTRARAVCELIVKIKNEESK